MKPVCWLTPSQFGDLFKCQNFPSLPLSLYHSSAAASAIGRLMIQPPPPPQDPPLGFGIFPDYH